MEPETEVNERIPVGGFATRMMPPTDWHCGDIPESCYDPNKGPCEIRKELEKAYLTEENIKRLAEWLEWRDKKPNPMNQTMAEMQLKMLAEIDANTIWGYNIANAHPSDPAVDVPRQSQPDNGP